MTAALEGPGRAPRLNAVVGSDDEGFAFCGKFSFPAQELDADGAIHFSVGEDPLRHDDIGAVVDFIDDSVFNVLGFHKRSALRI
jgi:hypothetical protein